jgi:hypothetical protein
MLGLFELATAAAPCPPLPHSVRFGEPILVYYVADLAAALRAVEAHGGSVLSGPEHFQIPGVTVSEAIVRDPDGVALNLVQAPEALAWTTTLSETDPARRHRRTRPSRAPSDRRAAVRIGTTTTFHRRSPRSLSASARTPRTRRA